MKLIAIPYLIVLVSGVALRILHWVARAPQTQVHLAKIAHGPQERPRDAGVAAIGTGVFLVD